MKEIDKTHSFFGHSANDGDQEILAIVEAGLNIFANVALWKLDIILWAAVLGHEVKETIVDVDLFSDRVSHMDNTLRESEMHKLVFITADVRNVHVVGRRADIFLLGER